MDSINDGLSFGIGLEISGLERDAKKIENRLASMTGRIIREGSKIDSRFLRLGGEGFSRFAGSVVTGGNNMSTSLRRTHAAMHDLKKSTGELNFNLTNFIKNFSAASLAVNGFYRAISLIKSSVDSVTNFEAANSTLGAILGYDISAPEMQAMMKSAQDLGRTTVYTATQVTQLQTELSKLGFSAQNIFDMQKAVLNFAQSTGAELGSAAATVGAALRMFGVSQEEYTEKAYQFSAAMSAATRRSALNFQAISDNLATFGPMAHSIGFEIEDVLALFGKLRDNGIEASTAMTSLRNIFTKMSQGKIVGMENVKSLDDFVDALERMKDVGTLSGSEGVGKSMKMIGPRGGTQFLALMQAGESIRTLRDQIKAEEDNGSLDIMGEQMVANFQGQVKMLASAWEGFMLQLNSSTGATQVAADGVKLITDTINDLTSAIKGDSSSEVLQTMLTVLEELIATYVVYNGIRAAGAVKEAIYAKLSAMEVAHYNAQAATLARLTAIEQARLTPQMESAVLTGKMNLEDAIRISQLQLLAQEELKNVQADLGAAQALLVEAKAAQAAARGHAAKAAALQVEEAENLVYMTQQKAMALQSVITGQKVSGLTKALNLLGLQFLANPYVWAAAAIAAIGIAVYKYATRTDEATLATQKHAEAMERINKATDERINKGNSLIGVINSETASIKEQYKAWNELKEMYKTLNGMSFEDFMKLSPEERKKKIEQAESSKQEDLLSRRAQVLEKISERYEKRTNEPHVPMSGTSKSYTERDEDVAFIQNTFKEFGFSDEEIKEELKNLGTFSDKLEVLAKEAKGANQEVQKLNDAQAIGNVRGALRKMENVTTGTLQKFKSETESNIKAAQDIVNSFDLSSLEDKGKRTEAFDAIGKQIEELEKKETELHSMRNEGNKASIDIEIRQNQADRAYLESLQGLFSGNVSHEAIVEVRASISGDTDYLDPETAKELSSAYKNTESAISDVAQGTTTASDAQKKMGDNIKMVDGRIEALKTKLKDPTLTRKQVKEIKVALTNAEQTKSDLTFFMDEMRKVAENPIHIKAILSFLGVNDGENSPEESGVPKWIQTEKDAEAWAQNHPFIAGVTEDARKSWAQNYAHRMGIQARAENANAKAVEEKDNEDDNAGSGEAQAKKDYSRLKELRAEQAKERLRAAQDLQRKINDAEISALEEGAEKSLITLQEKHQRELDELDRQEEDLKDRYLKNAKALWDAEQDIKKGGDDKYQKISFSSLSESEQVAFAKKNEIDLKLSGKGEVALGDESRTGMANLRDATLKRQQRENIDYYKSYTTERIKQQQEEEKFASDIAGIEKLIVDIGKSEIKDKERILDKLRQQLALAKQLKVEEEARRRLEFDMEHGTTESKKAAVDEYYRNRIETAKANGDPYEVGRLTSEQLAKQNELRKEDLGARTANAIALSNADDVVLRAPEMKSFVDEAIATLKKIQEDGSLGEMDATDQQTILNALDRLVNGGNLQSLEVLRKEASDASAELTAAREEQAAAEHDLGTLTVGRNNLQAILDKNPNDKIGSDHLAEQNKRISEAEERRRKATEAVSAAEAKLTHTTEQAIEAERRTFKGAMKEGLENFTNRYDKSKKEGNPTKAAIEDVGQLAGSGGAINESLDKMGIKMGEDAGKAMEGLAQGANAASKAMSGDFVGAAIDAFSMFGSFVDFFAGLSDNWEEMQDRIDMNTEALENLGWSLDKMRDELDDANSLNAASKVNEAIANVEQQERSLQDSIDATARQYKGASHSMQYYLDDEEDYDDIRRRIRKVQGFENFDFDRMGAYTAEQWYNLRKNYVGLYSELQNAISSVEEDHEGKVGKGLNDLLDQMTELNGQGDEFREKLDEIVTGFTFDSFKGDYKSMLKEMGNLSASARENVMGKTRDALISSIADSQEDVLQDVYKRMSDAIQRNDYDALRNLTSDAEKLAQEAEDRIDALISEGVIDRWSLTFSDVYGGFDDLMDDMESRSFDFFDNLQEKINKMFTDEIADKYKDEIEKAQKKINEAVRTHNKALIDAAMADYMAIVERARADRSELEQSGLIKDLNESEGNATSRMASGITREDGAEINGRVTTLAIGQQRQLSLWTAMQFTLQEQAENVREITQHTRRLAAIEEHLSEIDRNTKRL